MERTPFFFSSFFFCFKPVSFWLHHVYEYPGSRWSDCRDGFLFGRISGRCICVGVCQLRLMYSLDLVSNQYWRFAISMSRIGNGVVVLTIIAHCAPCICRANPSKLPHRMLSNRIQVVSISPSAYGDFVSTIFHVVSGWACFRSERVKSRVAQLSDPTIAYNSYSISFVLTGQSGSHCRAHSLNIVYVNNAFVNRLALIN